MKSLIALVAFTTLVNAAAGSSYDDGSSATDGRMTWTNAVAWSDYLSYYDAVRDVTYDDWRLPGVIDTGSPGCDFGYDGTDCGYNVDTSGSEYASLYYDSLGNWSYFYTSGNGPQPWHGLNNTGPFLNLDTSFGNFWTDTIAEPIAGGERAWYFQMLDRIQSGFWAGIPPAGAGSGGVRDWNVIALRDGDVAGGGPIPPDPSKVPVPTAVWLFGSAIGLLSWMR